MTETMTKDSGTGRLGAASAAVAVAGAVGNGLAYLVPVLGARHLTPGDLSALATALALSAIATVPGLGLQIAVAVQRAKHGPVAARRLTLVTALVCGGALLAATPLLTAALHLSTEMPVLLAAMAVALVIGCGWLGELQGDQRFLRLAVGMTILAVGRNVGIIAGLAFGSGLTGSLVVGVVVAYLALPVMARLAASSAPAGSPAVPGGLNARHVMTASSATLAMLVVSYADLILARHLLSPAESGAYAIGAVLTKGALWAPQVVTVIALPRLARGDRRTRAVTVGLVAASGAVLVLASAVAGDLAFGLAGGRDYVAFGRYAWLFASSGALYALVFALVNAQVAAGARWPSAPLWVATVGFVVAVLFIAPHTLQGIVLTALITALLTTIATAVATLTARPAADRVGVLTS
ncbi:polysaccharide biosynthesis protein [Micromonospora sp. NPDC049679]|uniref:polysaccharide biosynthesis protein n=1 Tax=Micromonospora sp. NPDC049679 TaxID=3155920 RepID=UPI0033FC36A7